MKILLLGANGNLGSQLFKVLSKKEELICFESSDVDLDRLDELDHKIADLKPDCLINTMAYNAVDSCESDETEYALAKKLNISLPMALARASLKLNSLLVHYSSDYVFGLSVSTEKYIAQGGFVETDNTASGNRYAKTKMLGERELLKLEPKGLNFYLIRTSKLFGPQGKSKFAKPGFFDIMLELAKTKNELKVVDDEMSCFTYTPDLATSTYELIVNKPDFGIYHIVNEGPATWFDGAKSLFSLSGSNVKLTPIKMEDYPRPANRPKYSVLKNTKLPKLRSYQEALKEYLKK